MNKELKYTQEYKAINDLTVLIFLLNDVQETLLLNTIQTFKDLKFKHKLEFEHKVRQALSVVQKLKKPVAKMDFDNQCKFGDVADDLSQLIFNIYIATGGHPKELVKINNLVLKYALTNPEEGKKYCPCCKKIKQDTEFYHNKRCKDGFAFYCKECVDTKNIQSRLKHKKTK